jgi:archaellum component FlaC
MAKKIEIIDSLTLKHKALVEDAMSLVDDVSDSDSKPKLTVTMDATHSGRLTNARVYPGTKMRKSVPSFLSPFAKPVLLDHNTARDPVGRVSKAKFIKLKDGEAFTKDFINPSDGLGSGFIQLTADITDSDAIEKFLDGRYLTISTRQAMDSLICSICGEDFAKLGFWGSEHRPGEVYKIKKDGKGKEREYLCYGIAGDMEYREVSVVNIPGDSEARVSKVKLEEGDGHDCAGIMKCAGDKLLANVEQLILSSDSGEGISLLSGPDKQSVTSGDRRKLTGKTIVAISPLFNHGLLDEDEESEMDKDSNTTEDVEKTKNTSDADASKDQKDESADSTTKKDSKEGVEAPKDTSSEEGTDMDDEVKDASLKALAKSVKDAEKQLEEKDSKIERLENTIRSKDEEIENIRKEATDAKAELKESYATTLLSNRIVLRKADVQGVKDAATWKEKLEQFSSRSLDSLKDAIADLAPEMSAANEAKGIPTPGSIAEDKKVSNPVSNKKPSKEPEKRKPKSKEDKLKSFLNS